MDVGMTGLTTMVCGGLAYMNPGTGSFILQVVMMGLAGAVVGFKGAWARIRDLLTRKR